MSKTLVVKTTVIDSITATDAAIATALNDSVTYTNIYGVSVVPISNTKAKIIVVYD